MFFFPLSFFGLGEQRRPFCDRNSSRTCAGRLGKVYLGQSTGWVGKKSCYSSERGQYELWNFDHLRFGATRYA